MYKIETLNQRLLYTLALNMEHMESEPNCRAASLIAYHLVNLVLQEGCVIANAAIESGRPREYLSTRKNVRSDLTYVIPAEDAAADSTVDNYVEGADNDKMEPGTNLLVTSTPQKLTDEKAKTESGQGDEDIEVHQNDLSNSTSLFINNLFDISDVELGIYDDATLQNADQSEQLGHFMNNVMDLYVNAALDAFHATQNGQNKEISFEKRVPDILEKSSFFYFEEALIKAGTDDVFYADDVPSCTDNVYEIHQDPMISQITLQHSDDIKEVQTQNSDLYENAYLTMNRDYDQCSEEEEFPILKDPKGMIMQEIALLTANTSNDTGLVYEEPGEKQREDLAATSGLTASSHKSGLVRRWRLQGTKFLACLRGWWRRKATRKRKDEGPEHVSRRGLGLSSPDPRRRTISLLERRAPPSPAPRYKSNTINEALINSSQWMEYSFETKPYDCGDV